MKSAVNVTSEELEGQLAQIHDRLSNIESILAHVHHQTIENILAATVGGSVLRKKILLICETPKSIKELTDHLGLNSPQALQNHLRPLREAGLLQHHSFKPETRYVWSSLIRRAPKATINRVLKAG